MLDSAGHASNFPLSKMHVNKLGKSVQNPNCCVVMQSLLSKPPISFAQHDNVGNCKILSDFYDRCI